MAIWDVPLASETAARGTGAEGANFTPQSNIWDPTIDATLGQGFTLPMTSKARGVRVDGISVAISVLEALSRSHGTIPLRELAALAPRSSLYRVIKTMAAAGIVARTKGTIGIGPLAQALLRGHGLRLSCETVPPARPHQFDVLGGDTDEASDPIILSRPLRWSPKRSGFHIGFSNVTLDSPWRIALVHSVERAAANLHGSLARFTVRHANDSAEQQAADIDELVAAGADGLVVSANASTQVRAAIERAMRRRVEVVIIDRGMRDLPPTSYVCTSDRMIGRITAQWLAETLRGSGGILLLPGGEGSEPAQRRLAAALEVFSAFPNITILETSWTDWKRERGYRFVRDAIERLGRQISGVWCDSGLQGVGSMKAFARSGWKNGTIPPHTGGDLNLAYKLAIRHQIKLAAVDCPPAMGKRAVEVLFDALQGRHVPSRVEVPLEVIVTEGCQTQSISPHLAVEDHVRWDLPDDLVLASGLGPAYNPREFRIHYRGNSYNRSAAQPARSGA